MTNIEAVETTLGLLYARVYESVASAEKQIIDNAAAQLLTLLGTTQSGETLDATNAIKANASTAVADLASYEAAVAAMRAAYPDPFAV